MVGIKGNRRTLYSKMMIKESLIKLLQTKDIHKITVTDICKEADINRGTFYSYYQDPYDLLQSVEDELFDKVFKYLNEDTEEDKVAILTKVFELASENKELCKLLLLNQGDHRILNKILYKVVEDDILQLESMAPQIDQIYSKYLIRYTISGGVGIIQAWLENDLEESPSEIATIVDAITSQILSKN